MELFVETGKKQNNIVSKMSLNVKFLLIELLYINLYHICDHSCDIQENGALACVNLLDYII